MTGIRPIYDAWLNEYNATKETLFSIDTERPELVNMNSRKVLDYAELMAGYFLTFCQQAIDLINSYSNYKDFMDRDTDFTLSLLDTALSALYMSAYYYDEMNEAIGVLSDRGFMMTPDKASYFMWVMQVYSAVMEKKEATNNDN